LRGAPPAVAGGATKQSRDSLGNVGCGTGSPRPGGARDDIIFLYAHYLNPRPAPKNPRNQIPKAPEKATPQNGRFRPKRFNSAPSNKK